ncbi:MAG: hypothetical protein AAFO81_12765 [Pseudomonadota bacterium]
MIRSIFLLAASLTLLACGKTSDDTARVADVVSEDDADSAYYDDFADDSNFDSLADDPEYGRFQVAVDGDKQSMRADCIVLSARNVAELENSSLSATFGIIQFTDDDASDWWSGEAMIRAVYSPEDEIDNVDAQYEVPMSEDAETDDGDFWMSMNAPSAAVEFVMTLDGAPFDYRTDTIDKQRYATGELAQVTMSWRGPMQGVLADGSDRDGQIMIDYDGLCQIN